jgi:hypothetical protein
VVVAGFDVSDSAALAMRSEFFNKAAQEPTITMSIKLRRFKFCSIKLRSGTAAFEQAKTPLPCAVLLSGFDIDDSLRRKFQKRLFTGHINQILTL